MGKPRGIRCARKMRNRRRDQRWADLGYKKANLGTALKVSVTLLCFVKYVFSLYFTFSSKFQRKKN